MVESASKRRLGVGELDAGGSTWRSAFLATVALFADVDADSLAGYGRTEPFTPAEETRIALYRAYLCLIMIVEGTPRGYRGPEHDSHVTFFRQKLAEYLS
ncbi:hypothetical protein GCM10010492_49560 [Saccharothrix mutabilis subsp. mutabilis]|uniref:Uncharacterized protein n=1 Tax=Saccharothrix mutabilis subsp. mutabilis TaxID=66855 RepID=A0ABP3DVT8_9PSEU